MPDDIDTLRSALIAEQQMRRETGTRASGAEAMVAHLKLMIARLRHDRFGAHDASDPTSAVFAGWIRCTQDWRRCLQC
jgi:hypothetical protein